MDPAAGMVRLVVGLGTRAVDRNDDDHACVVPLDQPGMRPFRDDEDALRFSQHQADTLDVTGNTLSSVPLRQLASLDADMERILGWCGERDREALQRAREHGLTPPWRISFGPLLAKTPFVPLVQQLLQTLEATYDYPVDVEFTVHIGLEGQPSFNLVQCRPLQTLGQNRPVTVPEGITDDHLLLATRGHFMGGSMDQPIHRVIRVDGERYSALNPHQKFAVARLVGQINRALDNRDDCPTLLIGPGRWGTSTPELGVPIRFADISRMAVIMEVAELGGGVVPDLSYGSHFFQDLVESRIAYVAVRPHDRHTHYHPQWLTGTPREVIDEDSLDGLDADVLGAVAVHNMTGVGLRLVADVVSQRLVCYQEGQ
jgi:hypothetical protein